MAWTWNISAVVAGEQEIEVFGQVLFSGNYTTGGDNGGTLVTTNGANTAGWPDVKFFESVLHATRPAHLGNIQIEMGAGASNGVNAVIVPVAASSIPKIKLFRADTGAELGNNAAYSAATSGNISASVYSSMQLNYRKNL
jgi:hypothetical protein